MAKKVAHADYHGPSGGWGSVRALGAILRREGNAGSTALALRRQNKHGGFMCVSCAWAKPSPPHVFEFCENGAKATAWDLTSERIDPAFLQRHSVTELEALPDHDLEQAGRLTEPMRWNPVTDRYEPVAWEEAFRHIGQELKALSPDSVVFYASGRPSNEAAYMYQLLARLYGTNNLPDSSNMCHESTSVALPKSLGVPVGTVTLEDFEKADCILIFGQNTASNSPRMLHQLDEAARRGVPIINFNPLRERGLERFINPQNPAQMVATGSKRIASEDHRLRAGGDMAAMVGICRLLLDWDEEARQRGEAPLLDWAFIRAHTHGFEAFADAVRRHDWAAIERRSGLTRGALEGVARHYAAARNTLGIYGMGLTQHRMGVETVQMLVSLLLLRGNIGRAGAGICPVRGHSNVQGQRAVWITEKPELVPLHRLGEMFGFDPPRKKGLDSVEAAGKVISGEVRAVFQLGGNLVRSLPERRLLEPAWRRLRMTVMVTTKLNRSHLVHGEIAYLLPCLSRIEIDRQASGPQTVSMEDSTSCIHASRGIREPASPHLRSEPAIIAGIAKAALPSNPRLDWNAWVGNYDLVRQAIAATYPEWYADYSRRMWEPGGFHRANPAREREWRTETGRANFVAPESLEADPDVRIADGEVLNLITVRSNDQFNTTIYGYDDRFRGIHGSRDVVMMNPEDMQRLGLQATDRVTLIAAVQDGVHRDVQDLQVVPFELPAGCAAGYYPECNPLLPLWHHAKESHVPAAKSIPVRVVRQA
ncbi:FdhF/YdeP family oxidoreductase [Plastoroseomonas hellenica]|uniref:FdhF/YdeP family oxidoreductase n=1 Tax=Plastoroseomonas hellenica TaxID=2687306 RepID=UPI001BAC7931|nr:FdhF/YdeP family oxidoreductase [Plastoroseomonas hellenica]MBR0645410.1 FdhF/YdeP family oxidoreductase [Plastoroseomonas hellenica]